MNVLMLLAANAAAWLMVAVMTTQAALWFGWQAIPTWYWMALCGLHSVALYSARLLPGWGLGIVNEVRLSVMVTSVLFLAALTVDFIQDFRLYLLPIGLTSYLLLVPAQLFVRTAVKSFLLRWKLWGVPVVVYGAAKTGERVIRALQAERGLGYEPVALFDDDPSKHGLQVAGVPVTGHTAQVWYAAPVAILAMPGAGRQVTVGLLDGPLRAYRHVILIPDLFDVQSLWASTHDLGGILGVHITHTLVDPLQRRWKRVLDLALVLISAPFWVPLCLLIGALIWLEDRHSPLFLQARVGVGGGMFKTWKFRTMLPHAEAALQQHLAADPALKAEWEKNYKLRRDPRITRVGGLLRKTSLDELPQLVNVLRGEMSLVGPRPLPIYHQEELPVEVQQLRREVRPGMTGLWQVSGRSDAGHQGMIQLDPYYVRNWSVWLDLIILFRTMRAVIRSAGAY